MLDDEEEKKLQKLLQVVMEKVIAAVPAHDPTFLPAPTERVKIEEPYACFPGLPRIRNYKADNVRQPNDRMNAEEMCNKKGYSHGSLSRGVFFASLKKWEYIEVYSSVLKIMLLFNRTLFSDLCAQIFFLIFDDADV